MQELVCSIKQYAVRNDWINVELDTEKHSLQINEVTFSFSLLYSKLFQEYYDGSRSRLSNFTSLIIMTCRIFLKMYLAADIPILQCRIFPKM